MESLLENFGVDWKLLASQAFNFLLLVVILRFTVYKPLLKIIAERRKIIREGLTNAEEADRRLASALDMQKEKRKEAEAAALALMQATEVKAKELEMMRTKETEVKMQDLAVRTREGLATERVAMKKEVENGAIELVRDILTKVVGVDPEVVDNVLLKTIKNPKV